MQVAYSTTLADWAVIDSRMKMISVLKHIFDVLMLFLNSESSKYKSIVKVDNICTDNECYII